ncbi:MAG TPA: indolepyruvate ferredoxin oxidoreductase family protein [Bryobacteraceae bacterium]|nr:indolepyruvate ferredoxin oxidoreductase family protein [Bryobacteraceae bacterium]
MPDKLDAKYLEERGAVYLTGIQALVRLPMDQMRRDRREGLSTAAFISGYEGSPLGGYDLALQRVRRLLEEYRIHFLPGVNEDLAATAVLGSQIHHILGQSKYDGVLGIWYGKGPGVDRSGDVLRHANIAGTGRHCAALVLAGDDHISKSSTIPHQSDLSLFNFNLPLFYPGNTQEILDYGMLAIALSRFSGAWASMKLVTNVCDGGGTVEVDPERPAICLPAGYEKRSDARLVTPFTLALEPEVNFRRLEAAREFARLNGVNQRFGSAGRARLGIATAGKAYYDVMQALADLGIRRGDLEGLGIRIAKFGMTYPLEPGFAAEFAQGLDTLLVVEEKRSFLELQLRDALYNLSERPAIAGKQDLTGKPLLPAAGELDPETLAKVLSGVLGQAGIPVRPDRSRVIAEIESREKPATPPRYPTFCSGCPHNRSTLLLEGQVAGGGIGCHGMAIQLESFSRGYAFLTHMGGEGAPWIGMAPFVERKHLFQNIGDGTYFHSGSLAVEACVAAGVNITYKILYNGAVAMTGGQEVAGALTVPDLTRKLAAEGVKKTLVLTDDPAKYEGVKLAANAEARDRDTLPEALRELEQVPGVTVIVYDQQCAAEKRRLRSRGKLEEPVVRLVIHEELCEGCGDCVRQSNCVSLHPVMTEYGQKTRIHQSSCNKDYSCLLGDCPSFLTVKLKPGTGLRKKPLQELPETVVRPPKEKAAIGERYAILSPGIGGTGVVTVNALLATAAWIDGLSVITLDQTGLAQKGGAVVSSLILSERPIEAAAKIGYGNADLLLGFDVLGAASAENLRRAHPARTVAVVNTAEIPTAEAIRGKARPGGAGSMADLINRYTRRSDNVFVDATRIAEGLFASHLAVNVFLLGVAYQAGRIPISAGAIEEAIRLNRVDVERNLHAFLWGRRYFEDARAVEALVAPEERREDSRSLVERRYTDLAAYQNRAYAEEYLAFVREVEARQPALADAVARYLYKLMAYKDEYEVARLLTRPEAEARVREMWEQVESVSYNLHPPLLRALGWRKKFRLGGWFRGLLRLLAELRGLRGTRWDPFGYAAARREERALIGWYRALVRQCLDMEDTTLALELVSLPDQIRGYENVKRENIRKVKALAAEKLAQSSRTAAPLGV